MYRCLPIVVGLLCVVGCFPGSNPVASSPGLALMLRTDGSILVDDQHSVSMAEFPDVLTRVVKRLEANGGFAGEIVATIDCDSDATCGDLKHLLTLCTQYQIEKFVMRFDRDFPFTLTRPASVPAVGEREMPSIPVNLHANADGSLVEIRFINRSIKSLDELHREAISAIGDDRGPGSVFDWVELEFRPDDGLLLGELGAAYQSVAGYTTGSGEFIPLFTRISPICKTFLRPKVNDYIHEDTEFILDEVEPEGQLPPPIDLEIELIP